MGKKLFRHTEDVHLFSLDKSDKPLKLVGLKRWMVLGIFGLVIFGIILWAVFGSIATVVTGEGVLFNPEGLYVVHSRVEGQVSQLFGFPKEVVNEGKLLAVIDSSIKELELDGLKSELDAQKKLLGEFEDKEDILEKKWELIELENQIETLEKYLGFQRVVVEKKSSIIRFHVNVSDAVIPGTPLVTLETHPQEGKDYTFYAFVTIAQGGELVKPGMKVKIEFSELGSEKYGYMLGKVRSIEPFAGEALALAPASYLRKELTELGPGLFLVKIDLTPDSETVSGYAWTTKYGPPFQLPSTSFGQARILVDQKRPISLIIPPPQNKP